MQKSIFATACLGLIFGLTVSASAQAGPVVANIPFSFTVFGKTLPAGHYSISADPHMIKIRDADRRLVVVALALENSDPPPAESGHLLFHCYSETCFFSEISFGPHKKGLQLLPSKEELTAAKGEKGKYFALLFENSHDSR
jgi:hypothetical protein